MAEPLGAPVPEAPGGIATERLLLRPLTGAESAAVAEGVRLAGWAPDFPAEADVEHAAAAEPQVGPFGFRLVVERAPLIGGSEGSPTPRIESAQGSPGLVVGSAGLEDLGDQAELFFGIVPSRRGRGYGAEAARALVAHAFAASPVDAVIAFVETANRASLRALAKAGFADNGYPPAGGATVWEVRRATGLPG